MKRKELLEQVAGHASAIAFAKATTADVRVALRSEIVARKTERQHNATAHRVEVGKLKAELTAKHDDAERIQADEIRDLRTQLKTAWKRIEEKSTEPGIRGLQMRLLRDQLSVARQRTLAAEEKQQAAEAPVTTVHGGPIDPDKLAPVTSVFSALAISEESTGKVGGVILGVRSRQLDTVLVCLAREDVGDLAMFCVKALSTWATKPLVDPLNWRQAGADD